MGHCGHDAHLFLQTALALGSCRSALRREGGRELPVEVKCRITRNLVVPMSVSGHFWPGGGQQANLCLSLLLLAPGRGVCCTSLHRAKCLMIV